MRYEWIWVSISAWLELLSVHGLAQEALKQAFLEQDVYLRSAEGKVALRKAKGKPSGVTAQGMGCTAVVALIRQGVLYVANCGDSRAVLVSGAGAVAMPGALGDDAEDWLLGCCELGAMEAMAAPPERRPRVLLILCLGGMPSCG